MGKDIKLTHIADTSLRDHANGVELLEWAQAADLGVGELADDGEHGESAVVELSGLHGDPVGVLGVDDAVSNAEVVASLVAGLLGGLAKAELSDADGGKDLEPAGGGDLLDGGKGVAAVSSTVEGVESVLGEDTEDGQHGNTGRLKYHFF
jgi:hypothetical protein